LNKLIMEIIESQDLVGSNFHASPYAIEIIHYLKAKGIQLAILSNTDNALWTRKIMTQCGFEESLFDAMILS
jgi:FMN phosphatase YigB (HAD superfamily)